MAKTEDGEAADPIVLDMVEELIHMEECNQRMHSKSAFELVLLNRSDPEAGKEAFERNRADFHEVRQGKHRVLKLRKDLPDELKQKLDLDSACRASSPCSRLESSSVIPIHCELGEGSKNSAPISRQFRFKCNPRGAHL